MSLANIIVQQPAAYLMSDSGWFNRDGTIHRLQPKMLEFPGLHMALTCRGQHDMLAGILREVQHFEAQRSTVTDREIIEAFPMLYQAACAAQGVPGKGRQHACDMQLVWYDSKAQRARGFLIANIVDDMPGLEPFALQPVGCSFTGSIDPDAPLGVALDVNNAAEFDIRRDGASVVERQRGEPWAMPGYPPAHYVAGTVYLTTVDQDGVRSEVLHSWPDRVGERVRLNSRFAN